MLIYDGVGGDYAEAPLCGRWPGSGQLPGDRFPRRHSPVLPLNLTLLEVRDVAGVFYGAAVARDPAMNQQNIKEPFDLYAAGKIRPAISRRYPLAEAAEAIKHLAARKALGKVVVTMD